MAKISTLSLLGAAPANDDELVILDVSDTTQGAGGSTKKLVATQVARTEAANTFAPPISQVPILINMPSGGSAEAIVLQFNGVQRGFLRVRADRIGLIFDAVDGGAGSGSFVALGRNSNGSTPSAAYLQMQQGDGDQSVMWVDGSANLRIGTAGPTSATDTSGTVIGTQTSWHELKDNIEEWDEAGALAAIQGLTLYSYQMIEDGQKNFNGEKPTYKGIVITEEDRTNNAWFGLGYGENQIPVLNERNLFGYILAAIKEQATQIEALTARVEALEGGQ